MDRRESVDTAMHDRARGGRDFRREIRQVGAHIRGQLDRQGEKTKLLVEREIELRDVVAPLRVGDEGFRAVGDPFDRPPDFFRGPQHQHVLGIEEQLHSEAAADIGGDDPDAVFRDMENMLGEHVAQKVRTLRRTPQRVGILARIVFADSAARLHP